MNIIRKGKQIRPGFFNRPTLVVAEDLLGKFLVRKIGAKNLALMITEVEAYDGFQDKGSHAHRGQTPRNVCMFGPPGFWYVYLVYGMHWMLNVVTREKGYPAAVLIRGVQGVNGPARVTKVFKISKLLNGKKADSFSGLWIEDRWVVVRKKDISKKPRIGIDYAGAWAKKPWRFILKTDKLDS